MATASKTINFDTISNSGSLTKLANSDYLAVWATMTEAGEGAVVGQVFDEKGAKKGAQFQVASGNKVFSELSVAALKDNGKVAVAWMDSNSIHTQVLDGNFNAIEDIETIASSVADNFYSPEICPLENGDFKILFKGNRESDNLAMYFEYKASNKSVSQASPDDIHHAYTLSPAGHEFLIYANGAGDLQVESSIGFSGIDRIGGGGPDYQGGDTFHSVSALSGGRGIVSWQDKTSETVSTLVIRAQIFAPNDAHNNLVKEGNEIEIQKPAGTIENTKVAELSDKSLVFVFTVKSDVAAEDANTYVVTCSANRQIISDPVLVGKTAVGAQEHASIVDLGNGAFAVSWIDYNNGQHFKTEIYGVDGVTPVDPDVPPKPVFDVWAGATEGDDRHQGTDAADSMDGLGGNDYLEGFGGNDSLVGGLGNDTLDGGEGTDTMVGGKGDDVYFMTPGDAIVEEMNGGYDTIIASFSASLGNDTQVEVLKAMDGTKPLTLGGANMNDKLIGNAGNNTLDGGDGNDTLDGGMGSDVMAGGAGDDTYYVDDAGDVVTDSAGFDTVITTGSYSLASMTGIESLMSSSTTGVALTGNAEANTLTGTLGNDTLDGGMGADILNGGLGNDTYLVDTALDVIVDAGGIDTVVASASYTLGAGLENLTASGPLGLILTGNALANTITGGIGKDKLVGGLGADVLTGGAGADTFVFTSTKDSMGKKKVTWDLITDFNAKQKDRIDLSAIDTDLKKKKDQKFTFIKTEKFHNVKGELRYEKVGKMFKVEGDLNGDGKADITIQVKGAGLKSIEKSYFIL